MGIREILNGHYRDCQPGGHRGGLYNRVQGSDMVAGGEGSSLLVPRTLEPIKYTGRNFEMNPQKG